VLRKPQRAKTQLSTGGRGGDRSEESIDERLVRAAARGDKRALAALYDRHAPALLALSRKILGDDRDAEDLVHDVFLEAWRSARDYDRTRGTVRAWLVMRGRSRAIDRMRARNRARGFLAEVAHVRSLHDGAADPSVSLDHSRVRGALAELPFEQRILVELGYFGGLSSAEIAARLGLPIGTVKSRVARAIRALRARFSAASSGRIEARLVPRGVAVELV
jgi:RNA polymerase sigma-70 factor, ECF subfamily